ncbi:MAG: ATP-binding cassette domain-containing protein [Myxococcota bacterium]|nr:ATP-binding cassette domain-containing protein [Myxococcota bacterium]
MSASDALVTRRLSKSFAKHKALGDLNINVHAGDIYGFLGPNGAGKTTAIRAILGLTPADEGEVSIFGESDPVLRLKDVGTLVENPCFHPSLSAYDNLKISLKLSGSSHNNIDTLLDLVGLTDRAHQKASTFSMGMKQRLGIARAMLGTPKLLILDEPTNGLDPKWRKSLRDILLTLSRDEGVSILISSHLLSEIEQTCNRVAILDQGRLQYEGAVSELRGNIQTYILNCDNEEALNQALSEIPQVTDQQYEADGAIRIQLKDWTPAQLNRELCMQKIYLHTIIPKQISLEDAFIKLTKDPS